MKRSERIFQLARVEAQTALWVILASVCAGVWSVRIGQEWASGGVLVGGLVLAGLCFAVARLAEAWRLLRLSLEEERWEVAAQPEIKL